MSIRLYVGNLPKEPVDRDALHELFADMGPEVSTKVIKDRKTGKCRGFAFVTVPTDELADQLIEKHNGQSFMDTPLKIEKALPREKGKSEKEAPAAPRPANTASKRSGKKRTGSNSGSTSSNNNNSGGATQPDPRWAADLAKLKEMLAAQTTNS